MIETIVSGVIGAATELLSYVGVIFTLVVELLYDGVDLTQLGTIIVATAGFALAWAGIRFVFGFVNRLLNKTRAGR